MKRLVLVVSATLIAMSGTLQAQTVGGSVYGGGRKANVGGTATVTVKSSASQGATSGSPAIGAVYGGNDIAGRVGGAILVDLQGGVIGDVFGGGNGNYGCSSNGVYTSSFNNNSTADEYEDDGTTGLQVPVVTNSSGTKVLVRGATYDEEHHTGLKVTGSIYAGGNLASVGLSSSSTSSAQVYLRSGSITNVYGGGRMAPIFGTQGIEFTDGTTSISGYTLPTGAIAMDAASTVHIDGDVYGSNDIANLTDEASNFSSSVIVKGNPVINGNVFGGGNGDYNYNTTTNEETGEVTYNSVTVNGQTISLCDGYGKPTVKSGTVTVDMGTGGSISGAVYGGGNAADVLTSTSVTLTSGRVATVYGGCNKSDITGYTNDENVFVAGTSTVTMAQATGSTLTVGTIYGGNDKSGTVTGLASVSISDGSVTGNVYGGSNGDYDEVNNDYPYGTRPSNENTKVTVSGGTFNTTSNVFGGGNAAAVSGTATVEVSAGTLNGNVFGGGNLATVGTTDVDITGGTINTLYGGGNLATVGTTDVDITGGTITTAYAGGNAATVSTTAAITMAKAEEATLTVGTLFGGNNQAAMSIIPDITLTSGIVTDVYGGGNAGNMTCIDVTLASVIVDEEGNDIRSQLSIDNNTKISTYINIDGSAIRINGNVYGGCRQADVTNATYVHMTGGEVNAIFGGNDIAGRCENTYVHIDGGQVTKVYGGSNGYGSHNTVYDYTSEDSPTRPSNTQTNVYIHNGTIPTSGAIYGGGLAAESENTYLLVDGSAVINGSLFGAGCGVQSDDCQAHLGNVTYLAKTDIKSMDATSTVDKVYGGGNAGDVARTELTLYNTCGGQFNTVYGGCKAANIKGTAQTIIGAGGGTTALNIGTLYGGNDYAGWVNKVDLQLLDGTLGTVFGAGNGDYADYSDKCDKVPFNNDIHITVADPACKGNSNLHITGNLYGGGNMGVVGFDYDKDGSIAQTAGTDSYTDRPQYANLFTDRETSVGEYGQIVIDVYGGTIDGNLFGGAKGTARNVSDLNISTSFTTNNALVYGLKQVNMYNGTVFHSVYGGSEGVNDGYPYEINLPDGTTGDDIEITRVANSSMRPSSILNIMGGTVTKNVYGAGYYGNAYGSVYVNVGKHAIDSCVAYQPYNTASGKNTRKYNQLADGQTEAYYVSMAPQYANVYEAYGVNEHYNLYLRASIYNGSDWGEAGANTVFYKRNFFGGESRIIVDGNGYVTTSTDNSGNSVLNIENSIYGSGTSCEGGDVHRTITVRNYGDFASCQTSRQLYSIQRADTLIFQNVGLTLIGEQDAYSSYPSPDYTINKIDKVVILREKNLLAIEAPVIEIGTLRSDVDYHTLMTNANVPANAEACASDMCSRIIPAITSKNAIVMRNGTYISVSKGSTYYPVEGYAYIDAEDNTQGFVFAQPYTGATASTPSIGGFMMPCPNSNITQDGITQLGYTNIETDASHEGFEYRTWKIGSDCGSTRTRKAAIVANTGVLKVNENATLPGLSYDYNNDTEIDSTYHFALAHTKIELPATNGGTFYTINAITVDNSAGGGEMNLVKAAWMPNANVAIPYGGALTAAQGRMVTIARANEGDEMKKIRDNNDLYFGLGFRTSDNFNNDETGTNTITGHEAMNQCLLVGSSVYNDASNFTQTPMINASAEDVIPTMDLYLTYDPSLTNTLLRDIKFTLTEHKLVNGEYCEAPVEVTIALATIITDFSQFEVDVYAMYNEGFSNQYIRKVILPATFQRRELTLDSVGWECKHFEGSNDEHECYGDPHLFHLVDMESAKDATNNYINITKNITNFGLTLGVTQSTGDATSNILGWYDIPAGSDDLDLYKESRLAPPAGADDRVFSTTGRPGANARGMLPVGEVIGTLDGRATAAIDVRLQYDGNLVYKNAYEGDNKLGTVTLKLSYLKKVDTTITINDVPTPTVIERPQYFTIKINVKSRKLADTFYVASASSLSVNGVTITANDASGSVNSNGDNPGRRPSEYFCQWNHIWGEWKPGDVIAVLDPVNFGEGTNMALGKDDEDNPIQIIRYSGSHIDFPGDTRANHKEMFRMSGNAKLNLRNLDINGSGLTRVKNYNETNAEIIGNQEAPYGRVKDTIYAHYPMFVVEGNAQLNLNYNVKLHNNINAGGNTETVAETSTYYGGGAIGIFGGEPIVTLGDGVEIYHNVVLTDDSKNNGAGVYVERGTLNVGGSAKNPPVVKVWDNYAMTDAHFTIGTRTETQRYPIEEIQKQMGAACPSGTGNTGYPKTFNVYVLDTALINGDNHQSNVFLQRVENSAVADAYHDRLDSRSEYITVKTELAAETKVGVTKWLEDGQLAANWERDTIRVVGTSSELIAGKAASNSNFVSDNPERNIFYNQILNGKEIYLHHCATFGQRLHAGFKSFELQEGTPVAFEMVAGTRNASKAEGAVNYSYVDAARCAVPLENVHFMVQGGFYPYQYTWSVGMFTGENTATAPAEDAYTQIRNFTTEYGPYISENKPEYSALRALSSSDTIALNEVALAPGVKEKAAIYKVTANDLTGFCPTNVDIYVKLIRTTGTTSWQGITCGEAGNENEKLDSLVNFTGKTYKYLRKVDGTDVKFEVAPSWDYGDIAISAQLDQTNAIPDGLVLPSTADNVNRNGRIYTVKETFCPGDELVLTTHNALDEDNHHVGEFVMWDFDASAPQANALYVVPETDAHVKAIYAPNDYWYQVVTSQPETFSVDYDGNVTIHNEQDLAWLISTTNGLNNSVATQYHNLTVTVEAKANDEPYDMSAHRWTPLGNINNHFAGTFNGSNVEIKGINCFEEDIPFVGFFGNTEGATIRNVHLNGTVITGSNYVGGIVASATDGTTITGCEVENVSAFSSDYVVGGIAGQVSGNGNTIDQTNIVDISLLGTVVSAGGCVGVMAGEDNEIDNVHGTVDASKLASCIFLGGVVAETNNGTTTGSKGGRKGAKDASTQNHIANNYVHLITNGNGRRVGGLVANANDVNLENNYAYGEILGSQRVGGIIAQVGSNVNVDRCFYEEGCANEAIASGAKSTSNVSTFSGVGNQVLSATSVDGINNVTRILNRWVREQGEGYNTWRSDLKFENHGYPIFGEPDMIPVNDTTVENVCDQFVYEGNTYTSSAIFTINVVDSVEMIDSTMYFVYHVGYSDYQEYADEAQVEEGFEGYGFSLTADQLEEMMDGATDVRTFILVDSMLTEHGCDSVITLTLTVYPKQGVDVVDADVFEVSVYPNPTRGNVTVEAKEMTLIEVYDNTSRRVMTRTVQGDKEQLNLSTLASGTYYLRVTTEHGTAVKKVIKK